MEKCLRERMRSQDTELLIHSMTLLATNGWERSESPSFGYAALDAVCVRFKVPLESASVDLTLVQEEWDDMVGYGRPDKMPSRCLDKCYIVQTKCPGTS